MVSGGVIAIIVIVIIVIVVGIIVYFAFFQNGDDTSNSQVNSNNSSTTDSTTVDPTTTNSTDSTTGGTVDDTVNPSPLDGGGVNQGNDPEPNAVILQTVPEKVKFVYPPTGKYIGLSSTVSCSTKICLLDVTRQDSDPDTEWVIELSPTQGRFNIRNSLTNLYLGLTVGLFSLSAALQQDRTSEAAQWIITDVDGGLITIYNPIFQSYLAEKGGSKNLSLNTNSNLENVKFQLIEF